MNVGLVQGTPEFPGVAKSPSEPRTRWKGSRGWCSVCRVDPGPRANNREGSWAAAVPQAEIFSWRWERRCSWRWPPALGWRCLSGSNNRWGRRWNRWDYCQALNFGAVLKEFGRSSRKNFECWLKWTILNCNWLLCYFYCWQFPT